MEASISTPDPAAPVGGLATWWGQLPANTRAGLLLGSAVLLALVVFLSLRVSQPAYAPVYSGLAENDAARIAQALQQRGIPFRLNEAGSAVMVPSNQRDQARLAVAGDGVLPTGPRGYEILDNPSPFSLSDFSQRVNLQRAREGELARTLMSLDAIRDARVMLTLPDDSPFLSERGEPGASVALTLRGGRQALSGEEAATIANLVAASVPGLDPSRVVIVDQQARLLAGPDLAGGRPTDAAGRSLVENFEARLESKVRTLLEAAFGSHNVRVSVTADLDLDRLSSTKETFVPEPDGKGVPRSEQVTEESTQNTPGADSGLAGTVSNIPSYPVTDSAGGTSRTRKSDSLTNYEISSVREVLEKAPGTVRRLSVSVLLDEPELDAQTKSQVESLIRGAINFDTERGDVVEVLALPFNTEAAEQAAAGLAEARKDQMWERGLQIAGWVVIAVLFAGGCWMLLKLLGAAAGTPGRRPAFAGGATGSEGVRIDVERPQLTPEEQAKQKIRDEIQDIAQQHPEEAAKVIRSWLRE